MQTIDELIDDFINELSVEKGQKFNNMYEGALQRDNLRAYLNYMHAQEPKILLVGEAAGYKGCGRTGIPFTDEDSLLWLANNVSDLSSLQISSNPPTKEQSAQIIWEVLKQNDDNGIPKFNKVLMWNTFPFHPFKDNNLDSNRRPDKAELEIGKKFLTKLIDMFSRPMQQIEIHAVGNIAEDTILKRLKLNSKNKIRHPAHGGKTKCQEGLNQIL